MPVACQNISRYEMFARLAENGFGQLTFFADDLLAEPDGQLYSRNFAQHWYDVAHRAERFASPGGSFDGLLLWLNDESAPRRSDRRQRIPRARCGCADRSSPAGVQSGRRLDRTAQDDDGCLGIIALGREWLAAGRAVRGWIYFCPPEAERFGFFAYDFSHWPFCMPYERIGTPPHRALIADLPPPAGHVVSFCQLTASDFSRDMLLQPIEHGHASFYGEQWITSTGCVVRGREVPADRPSPTTWWDVVYPGEVATSNVGALVEGWLRDEPDAGGVLNDYLQEHGRTSLPDAAGPAARLDFVLLEFFEPGSFWQSKRIFSTILSPGRACPTRRW